MSAPPNLDGEQKRSLENVAGSPQFDEQEPQGPQPSQKLSEIGGQNLN